MSSELGAAAYWPFNQPGSSTQLEKCLLTAWRNILPQTRLTQLNGSSGGASGNCETEHEARR